VAVPGEGQRALFRRWPAGVSIIAAEVDGRRAGLTVSSLTSLSLEPALVGISIALAASLHDVLRVADTWTASLLAGDQEQMALQFAASLPADEAWAEVVVRDHDRRQLAGAVGWLTARTVEELSTGDHTFFVGQVLSVEQGKAPTSLAYVHRKYARI
jgi:flavin reductase (DIM6/NTAB) family NADH-FMN oxidoreductase RutF